MFRTIKRTERSQSFIQFSEIQENYNLRDKLWESAYAEQT